MIISAEMTVLLINATIMSFAYVWLYPKVAGDDMQKIALYDAIASMIALATTAYFFSGQAILFELFSMELTWFWFWLMSYVLVEVPLMMWYFKKYDVTMK